MNFFKKLFKTSKANNEPNNPKDDVGPDHKATQQPDETAKVEISGIATHEYFDERYEEDTIDEGMLATTLQMIEQYFPANKIKPIVAKPINHPKNLDQTIDDGFGFVLYCSAMEMEEHFAIALLSMAFNDFLIKNHGFKLYKDSQPEYPMRSMTLKYDHKGTKLSLYPIEYTTKVINYQASFNELYERIKLNLEHMPTSDDVYNDVMGKSDGDTGQ